MMSYLLICVLLVIIVWWLDRQRSEGFVSRDEKYAAIASWWKNTSSPNYAQYRVDVPESDVIEYMEVKRAGGKNVTTTQLKRII